GPFITLMRAVPVEPGGPLQMLVASWLGQLGWRWMFGAVLVPALSFLVPFFFVGECGRWLMNVGKPESSRDALVLIG
ncbi:MFS transporter, partial [Klebsiella pneumoniae]|uniref:MFS transporter n=1 Tax=Klebsiella pneumoniae TaxID=573 RepID=UPI00272F8ADB